MEPIMASGLLADNVTTLGNHTDFNDTVDWEFWEKQLFYTGRRQYSDCTFADVLEVNNKTIMLHPWADLEPQEVQSLCGAITVVGTVSLALVISVGIPGNILSFLTILTLPKSTGAFYVAVLSCADLVAIIMRVIDTALSRLRVHDMASCKIMRTLTNYTGVYANWILILICFERFFTVKAPLKKNAYFTMKKARLAAFILALFLLPYGAVFLWHVDAKNHVCVVTDLEFEKHWVHVESLIYSFLPAILLILMVTAIAIELKKIQKNRKSTFCGHEAANTAMTRQRLKDQARIERSITIMLLCAAIVFILLSLPVCLIHIIDTVGTKTPMERARMEVAKNVALALTFLSHALNFFIYFISTQRFRTQLCSLFKCSCCRNSHGEKDTNNHTTYPDTEAVHL